MIFRLDLDFLGGVRYGRRIVVRRKKEKAAFGFVRLGEKFRRYGISRRGGCECRRGRGPGNGIAEVTKGLGERARALVGAGRHDAAR